NHSAQLNDRGAEMERRWRALLHAGRIKSLEVVLYEDFPLDYVVVIDDLAVIPGVYVPNDDSTHGNDFLHPHVVINTGTISEIYVAKYRAWFDTWFTYWGARGGPIGQCGSMTPRSDPGEPLTR